jgi:hypothetical protein
VAAEQAAPRGCFHETHPSPFYLPGARQVEHNAIQLFTQQEFIMQPQRLVLFTAATLGIGLLSLAPGALAANEGSDATMDCHMVFTLRG